MAPDLAVLLDRAHAALRMVDASDPSTANRMTSDQLRWLDGDGSTDHLVAAVPTFDSGGWSVTPQAGVR